jgi:hypothetical protein
LGYGSVSSSAATSSSLAPHPSGRGAAGASHRPGVRGRFAHCCECQDICVDQSDEVVGSTEGGIDIIVARRGHIPEVERMLSAAFHRAAALGYQQWWDPFPVAVLEDSVLRGETPCPGRIRCSGVSAHLILVTYIDFVPTQMSLAGASGSRCSRGPT